MIRTRIGVGIGACALAVALAAGACSGDDDAADVTVAPDTSVEETTTTTEATTTTTEDPTAAVEQAFFDQWDALVELSSSPDVSDPRIDEFFTGEARDNVVDALSRLIAEGFATRLPDAADDFRITVNEVRITGPVEAVVFECSIDGLVVYDVNSGEVIDDDVSSFEKKNYFELIEGQWRLARTKDLAAEDPQCG